MVHSNKTLGQRIVELSHLAVAMHLAAALNPGWAQDERPNNESVDRRQWVIGGTGRVQVKDDQAVDG